MGRKAGGQEGPEALKSGAEGSRGLFWGVGVGLGLASPPAGHVSDSPTRDPCSNHVPPSSHGPCTHAPPAVARRAFPCGLTAVSTQNSHTGFRGISSNECPAWPSLSLTPPSTVPLPATLLSGPLRGRFTRGLWSYPRAFASALLFPPKNSTTMLSNENIIHFLGPTREIIFNLFYLTQYIQDSITSTCNQ